MELLSSVSSSSMMDKRGMIGGMLVVVKICLFSSENVCVMWRLTDHKVTGG